MNLFNYNTEENIRDYGRNYSDDMVLAYFDGEKMVFLENSKGTTLLNSLKSDKLRHSYSYDFTRVYIGSGRWSRDSIDKNCLKFINSEDFKTKFPYSGIESFAEKYDGSNGCTWRYRYPSTFVEIAYATLYCEHPEIEQLCKVGLGDIVADWCIARLKENTDTSKFSRAFKTGKNMDEITKMPKYAWSRLLKNCKDINDWNEMRIWVQKDNLSADDIDEVLNQNLRGTALSKLRKLASKKFDGKNVYTFEGLINYLHRCDVYQAIPQYEAIQLLEDYVRMCCQMGVEPLKTTNSLKREHDVMARNYNIWAQKQRFEKEQSGFAENSKRLQKYEWTDGDYVVTTPRTIEDLINEGIHNHNCVGSYVDKYAAGKSNIFFIRKAETPERSYITIELNSTLTDYKQAFLSSNMRITKDEDWKFIHNWLDHCEEVNKEVEETSFYFYLNFSIYYYEYISIYIYIYFLKCGDLKYFLEYLLIKQKIKRKVI